MTTCTPPSDRPRRAALSRRALLSACAGLGATLMLGKAPALAANDGPAARHMRAVSKELLAAARSGDHVDFLRALQRHAAISEIAEYSLGEYRGSLTPRLTSRLQRGVTDFMARYFATEAQRYRVKEGRVTGESPRTDGRVVVHSVITLASGTTYNVNWLLQPEGRRFKIRDVQVLGFWLGWFQRRMFVSFISRNGGDVTALLAALRV